MAKMTNDQIAQLAERIAEVELLFPVRGSFNRPLFRTVILGEKYPTADLLVDVLQADGTVLGHFFVQVKGTASASPTAPRLAIDVKAADFNKLVQLVIPSYLLAVDTQRGLVYLAAACRTRKTAVASVTKAFPLADDAVKISLSREVCGFWTALGRPRRTSRFHDA